eukprot:172621-Alexandrium_andersonii.AAC.1
MPHGDCILEAVCGAIQLVARHAHLFRELGHVGVRRAEELPELRIRLEGARRARAPPGLEALKLLAAKERRRRVERRHAVPVRRGENRDVLVGAPVGRGAGGLRDRVGVLREAL